ncbi:hypothetical protein PHYBLDRAFT_172572 [Phycomyces blakesleeanus NRRL 1555(-)]|uniref:Uncharacterized protein n=1 Tax=Phycomyces blakesleeanus (strain ATCC 8743b / DSM 1359 / FGSC 10004 / NBRC 33097 / NRRL 1555) TaxID=763407 RepID=A0A163D7H5_PHYB8|nr:hypothetical protein PHYBLDRAFT_172572 [Phycomyces blakesleeanus NRRL 1555(-)]OAD69320.1 hypothetical protein PHYBLDRAFT_172572 [Phycomyces blakesleeanus NRRL 1555(-)]|eukprot:XP_018287360.1 hypothetical protein PHYBLDRAFT_172572 [Phycomyces blakesleeanus NRRL 1555(-)]
MEWEEEQSPEQNLVDEGLDAEMEEVAKVVKTQKKHYNGYSSEQKLLFVYSNRLEELLNEQYIDGPRDSKKTKIGTSWKNKPTKSIGQRRSLMKDIMFIYSSFMMITLNPELLMQLFRSFLFHAFDTDTVTISDIYANPATNNPRYWLILQDPVRNGQSVVLSIIY